MSHLIFFINFPREITQEWWNRKSVEWRAFDAKEKKKNRGKGKGKEVGEVGEPREKDEPFELEEWKRR